MKTLLMIMTSGFVFGCMSQRQQTLENITKISSDSAAAYIGFALIEPDAQALREKKDIFIKFRVKNKQDKVLYINDPKYYINIIPFLYKEGKMVQEGIKMKIDIRKLRELVCLEALEEKEITLEFRLDYLYRSFLTKGNYTLILEYNGGIFDSNQKEITHVAGIRSNEVEFSIE